VAGIADDFFLEPGCSEAAEVCRLVVEGKGTADVPAERDICRLFLRGSSVGDGLDPPIDHSLNSGCFTTKEIR